MLIKMLLKLFLRCFLSAGFPAASPSKSRIVEAICTRLCDTIIGRTGHTKSRWNHVLYTYGIDLTLPYGTQLTYCMSEFTFRTARKQYSLPGVIDSIVGRGTAPRPTQ